MSIFCVNCGVEMPSAAGFCPACGTKVEISHCPACGKESDFDSAFCIHCGHQMNHEEQSPSPVEKVLIQEHKSFKHVPNQTKEQIETQSNVNNDNSDLRDIIVKNTSYYLPQFEKVKRGEKCNFNWGAFFFGPLLCFYRRSTELFKKFYLKLYIACAVVYLANIVVIAVIHNVDAFW